MTRRTLSGGVRPQATGGAECDRAEHPGARRQRHSCGRIADREGRRGRRDPAHRGRSNRGADHAPPERRRPEPARGRPRRRRLGRLLVRPRQLPGDRGGGGNGDDTVRIDQANGAFTTTEATRIDGGNGDDTLLGGRGAEVFLGGNGDDVVDGNGGVDVAFLGRGDNEFVWDPGDGSDVVEGEEGRDGLVFNGAGGNEIIAASADGGRVLFTRNLGNIVMDLDGIELIDVRALGGTDAVTINDIGGTDLERVDVDLAVALGGSTGDGLADTVTVTGTKADDSISVDANGAAVEVSGLAAFVRITHADPAVDTLVIDTAPGADDVDLDPALDGLVLVSLL